MTSSPVNVGRGRPRGYTCSEETRRRISESKIGLTHSEESKQKISAGVRKAHDVGAPIELLMSTDLSKCKTFRKGKYVCVIIPEYVGKQHQMMLHVAVMEKHLGRKLMPNEEIHHWMDKENNDIKYLTVVNSRTEHIILDYIKQGTAELLRNTFTGENGLALVKQIMEGGGLGEYLQQQQKERK